MASKLEMYSELADRTAHQITGSFSEWTAFLKTAARLYKYPFHEQLLIYAQRPTATACAEYDVWNQRMGRLCAAWVLGHRPHRHHRQQAAS